MNIQEGASGCPREPPKSPSNDRPNAYYVTSTSLVVMVLPRGRSN